MIKIIPNKKDIGAEIECDLKKISNQDLKKIKQALYKYGVIFFKKQILTSSSVNRLLLQFILNRLVLPKSIVVKNK